MRVVPLELELLDPPEDDPLDVDDVELEDDPEDDRPVEPLLLLPPSGMVRPFV